MQKQAPSLGRVLTMVLFALSCFGLLLFLWLSFGGPIPLKPKGYQFKVAFPEATQLGLEADVRVAGVSIGKVRDKTIDPAHPNRTVATIEVTRKYAPIAKDARAILRQKTLLGETYVEMTPGNKRAAGTVPDGGFLGDARVTKTVELDEIFQALDPKTRKSFQTWQQDLSKAVAGRGRDLNDALGNLPAFADDGNDLLTVLDGQAEQVSGLVRGTGQVFGRSRRTRDSCTTSSSTRATPSTRPRAGRRRWRRRSRSSRPSSTSPRPPSSAWRASPRTPTRSSRTCARRARPDPTLRDVRALAPDLRTLFVNLDPLITASKTGLPALRDTLTQAKPLLAQTQPFLEQLNPILQWLEYHQLTTSDFIYNGAAALADTTPTVTDNEVGHYLRQFGPTGPETVGMYPQRPAASRGNAYPAPDALTGPKRDQYMMFGNFDCKNAGGERMTQVPDTSDDPSCFVQPAPAWPPGNSSPYPHIGAADYAKPSGG
jgi:ABC-type transporter Mla subunit MlaD